MIGTIKRLGIILNVYAYVSFNYYRNCTLYTIGSYIQYERETNDNSAREIVGAVVSKRLPVESFPTFWKMT
jgi:hypothetical protein